MNDMNRTRLDLPAAFLMGYRWLSIRERRQLVLTTVALALVSVLDLLGVLLLALVTALILSLANPEAGALTALPKWFPQIHGTASVLSVAVLAAIVLAVKSLLSWLINRRVLNFMALREVGFAQRLYVMYMSSDYTASQSLSTQPVVSGIYLGSRALSGILSSAVSLVAETVLVVSLSALLLVSSPILFLFAAVYFGAVAVSVSRFVGSRSLAASEAATSTSVKAQQRVHETIGLARELRVYKLWRRFGKAMIPQQEVAALSGAAMVSWASAPRYFLETALVVGIALAAGIVLVTQPPDRAIIGLGLYVVTSSRLLPAIQRLNGAWTSSKSSLGMLFAALPILNLPAEDNPSEQEPSDSESPAAIASENGMMCLENMTFRYGSGSAPALNAVSIDLAIPSRIAIIGPSGSGKSTLADIFLGLIHPSSGSLTIYDNGRRVHSIVHGYVPQDVYLTPGSVRANVSLYVEGDDIDDDRVWRALKTAQIDEIVRALPEGLDTPLGERGVRLSGGQRQRVGLARALYREPQILILDEATSSLDADTEREVADAIRSIPGNVTVVTIAHRLATIRDADIVLYLREGVLIGADSFANLAAAHPELARTAELQGLNVH